MSGIRVICRLRPQNKVEREAGGGNCVEFSDTTIKINTQERQDDTAKHEFTFDRICGPECPQSQVFEVAARPVVAGVLDGYNGTIFAYGQTGSGKTFTMEGPDIYDPDMKGIIPRMMDALFEGLVQASESYEFTLKCSFLEIYLERIQDLLDNSKSNLQLKEDKNRGIYVQDASEVYVGSPAEMVRVMNTGAANRSIAATRMNARSSRSHSIFCVHVDQRDTESGSRKSGRLYFVDLAGSEKIAKTNVTGKQLEEAKMINKSLSALGNVINALTDKNASFVPYRDSKLTRMLQESLGGNSQTTLVIACSMNSYNDRETLSTLRFGLRAKKIQNKPIVNQEMSAKELMKQLEQAQKEINKQSEIIANLKTHIQSNYGDNQQLVNEVAGIIDNSFTVVSSNSKHESEHSLILLKQHTEIISLNEELQKVRLEKKEIEDELNYRLNDISEYEAQLQDLNAQLSYEQENHSQAVEELQVKLETALFKHQQQYLDAKKLRTTIERLRQDVLLVHSEVPEDTRWLRILQQSMEDALTALNSLAESAEAYSSEPTLAECEASTERGTNTEASFALAAEDPRSDMKTLVADQRSTIDDLQQHNSRLQEDLEQSKVHLLHSQQENMHLVEEAGEISSKLKETMEHCAVLEKQLELKVRNIEEERETVKLELQAKDNEIEELRRLLGRESSQALPETPKGVDVEARLNKMCDERQELYEELVKLRKSLDERDEQLHNALQRNRRLERQLAAKRANPTSPSSRMLSPRSRPSLQEPQFFNKRVMKPIRGGGGDLWNFQQRNQGFGAVDQGPTNSVIRNKQKIERLTNQNKGGIGSMMKEFFGFWS